MSTIVKFHETGSPEVRRVEPSQVDSPGPGQARLRLRLHFCAIAVFLGALSATTVTAVHAQAWPTKPIRLVVPAPPGGISDGVARLIAEQLHANLGQPVIVENKPGGSAVIAERAVMNAPADGHTLMVAPSSVWTDMPLTIKTPFDPQKTFTYVADVASMVHLLVANNSFAPNKIQEVLELARQGKEPISVANLTPGTRSDLLGTLLSEKSGRAINVVPYKGSAPAIVDLLGNQVQLTFEVVSNTAPLIKAGKLKALGVVSPNRSRLLPEVPSFAEQGMPDFVMPDASVGLFVLSSQPRPLTDRIRKEMEKIMRSPKFRALLQAQGLDAPKESSLEELQQRMLATVEQNRKIMSTIKLVGSTP